MRSLLAGRLAACHPAACRPASLPPRGMPPRRPPGAAHPAQPLRPPLCHSLSAPQYQNWKTFVAVGASALLAGLTFRLAIRWGAAGAGAVARHPAGSEGSCHAKTELLLGTATLCPPPPRTQKKTNTSTHPLKKALPSILRRAHPLALGLLVALCQLVCAGVPAASGATASHPPTRTHTRARARPRPCPHPLHTHAHAHTHAHTHTHTHDHAHNHTRPHLRTSARH